MAQSGPDGGFEQYRDIVDALARSVPVPPEIHWGRWRAELAEKLEARRARRSWWARPVPLALSAGLAGVLVFIAIWGAQRPGTGIDLVTLEEAVIGGRLGLLQQYRVVERLDLLEELDVIRNLDRLITTQEGQG